MEDETEAEGEEKDTEEAVEILCEPDSQSASHSRHNSGHTRRNRKTEEVSHQHLLREGDIYFSYVIQWTSSLIRTPPLDHLTLRLPLHC